MAKEFNIPERYHSSIIGTIKEYKRRIDPHKKDYAPIRLNFGNVVFYIPRHLGLCYGVENAIDIAYKVLAEESSRNIYLLNEMIHNPTVNEDLKARGIKLLYDSNQKNIIPLDTLTPDDVVIIPAFGTTIEIEEKLAQKHIEIRKYDTTCPFVKRVWKRGTHIAEDGYTIILHGNYYHEETQATFSRIVPKTPIMVIKNVEEAKILAHIIDGTYSNKAFNKYFAKYCSPNFLPEKHLQRIGIINQTTMLATETKEIIDILSQAIIDVYGKEKFQYHFANTTDTLCYATNENQISTRQLSDKNLHLALVIGGYNSSNTMHLAEILSLKRKVYHIKDVNEILSKTKIRYQNIDTHTIEVQENWLSQKYHPINIGITSGASCPDAFVDAVLLKVLSFYDSCYSVEDVLSELS